MWRSTEQRRTTEERLGRREDRANFLNFFLAFLLKQQSGSCLFALSVRPQRTPLKLEVVLGLGQRLLETEGVYTGACAEAGVSPHAEGPAHRRPLTHCRHRSRPPKNAQMFCVTLAGWLDQFSSAHRPAAAGFQPSSSVHLPLANGASSWG